jgi:hypothetical protein
LAELATSHELITSFVGGLGDFLNTLVGQTAKTNVARMFFIAGSDQAFSWQADLDGFLVAIQDDMGSSGVHTISLNKFATTDLAGASKLFPQLIYIGSGTTVPQILTRIRLPVRRNDRIWFSNAGASPFRVVLWFEV